MNEDRVKIRVKNGRAVVVLGQEKTASTAVYFTLKSILPDAEVHHAHDFFVSRKPQRTEKNLRALAALAHPRRERHVVTVPRDLLSRCLSGLWHTHANDIVAALPDADAISGKLEAPLQSMLRRNDSWQREALDIVGLRLPEKDRAYEYVGETGIRHHILRFSSLATDFAALSACLSGAAHALPRVKQASAGGSEEAYHAFCALMRPWVDSVITAKQAIPPRQATSPAA